jgi:hypothetical protein
MIAGIQCRAQDRIADDAASPAAPSPSPVPAAAEPKPVDTPPAGTPFLKRLFSLEALGATVPSAIVEQVHDWPDEWGKKRLGFEKRTGSLYAQFVVGILIADGVKAIHPEDTRYRRSGQGNFFQRTARVIAGTMAARKPDGGWTPAWSLVANDYGSWALATLWSPRDLRNARSIFVWGSAGMATAPVTNFVREFWPDVRGVFRKKTAGAPAAP